MVFEVFVAMGAAWRVGDEVEGLYRVTAVHSQGGMGVVYRVRHLGWDVDLAVKSPRPALFRHRAGRDRFVAEAQTWISLGLHPHLCSCFYVRTIDGIPRIFAEYAEGGSVRDLLDGGGPAAMTEDEALAFRLDLAIQMAWGLEHAHRNGVVHQDVKPANVLLGTDGAAKVTDFGLSRSRAILATEGRGDVSVAVTAGGFTPAYASPEQAAGRPLDRRTDVWSHAVTVLETFSGGATWGSGPQAPATLSRLQAGLPAGLAGLLGRCLREEPSARPGSMAEIADELRDIHEREVGLYDRDRPTEVTLRADELNNRALSQLDLGADAQADAMFADALAIDPNHVEAVFNAQILRWRRAEISDETAVATMAVARDGAPGRWEGAYLLGQMHLERGDLDAALPLLREAAAAIDDPEVAATLRRAEAGELAGGFEERLLDPDHEPVTVARDEGWMTAACISTDGTLAATARLVRHPIPRNVRTYLFGYERPPDEYPIQLFTAPGRMRTLTADRSVSSLDLSADGRLLASGEANHTVRLWDVATGRCEHVLPGHTHYVTAVRFGPPGRILATAALDHRIRLWDVVSGRCLLELPQEGVRSLSFSADGSLLAAAGDDRTLRLWDLSTGRCRQAFVHPDRLQAVGLSGGARSAVTGGHDALHVWDLTTGERRHVLGGPVMELWLHDGLVLAGDRDGEIRLWDTADGRCLRTFGGYRDVAARLLFANEPLQIPVRIDGGGRRAHSVGNNYRARSWGLPTGYRAPLRLCRPRPTTRVQELDRRVRALVRDGETAIDGGRPDQALTSLSEARTVPGHERDATVVGAWRRLSLAAERTGLRAAWLSRAIEIPGGPDAFWYPAAAISGDGRYALTTSRDTGVILWDLDTGRPVRRYIQPEQPIYVAALDMSVDGSRAVTGDGYRRIQLWDLRAGTRVHDLGEPESSQISIAVDRAGRTALVERGDGVPRLWDLTDGRELRAFHGPKRTAHYTEGPPRKEQEQVNAVALSSDGRVVASALQYSGGIYWTGRRRQWRDLHGYTDRVDTVRISADARFALTGGWDATVRHWDLATGRCRQIMTGHTHPVLGVDLSADGRFALSAGMDDTVRIWDVTDGRCAQVLEGVTGAALVRIAEDGSRAVSIGADGLLRVWELDWELTVREPADWDERARPYLDQHHPDEDLADLLVRLRRAGLGRLRPEAVRRRLDDRRA